MMEKGVLCTEARSIFRVKHRRKERFHLCGIIDTMLMEGGLGRRSVPLGSDSADPMQLVAVDAHHLDCMSGGQEADRHVGGAGVGRPGEGVVVVVELRLRDLVGLARTGELSFTCAEGVYA